MRDSKLKEEAQKAARKEALLKLASTPMALDNKDYQGAILFFVPEGGLMPHIAAQLVVARTLKELGHKVLFVRCFKTFDWCPVYEAFRMAYPLDSEAATRRCLDCLDTSSTLLNSYGIDYIDLNSRMDEEIRSKVDRAMKNCPDDLHDFQFESLPFGTMALCDLSLAMKQFDYSVIDDRIRLLWLRNIRNAILSYLLSEKIYKEFSISRVLIYNTYALLMATRLSAHKHNIPSLTLSQAGVVDRRRYVFYHRDWATFGYKALETWPQWRKLALAENQIIDVADDGLRSMQGKLWHLFAKKARTVADPCIHDALKLDRNRKLLVAYTSSLDEIISGALSMKVHGTMRPVPDQPFKDQIEWLDALINYVEKSEDLQLVIRVHPREGAATFQNEDGSQHLVLLRKHFSKPFSRTRLVWPKDLVSSYDLAEAADLILVSWSAIGMEMARLGVPILSSTMGVGTAPHDEFMAWGATPKEYFRELEVQLSRPPSLNAIALAYRSYHLINFAQTVDLSDIVPHYNFTGLPTFKLPLEARAMEQVVVGRREIHEVNFEKLQAAQQPLSADQEQRTLTRQLRRMIHFLFTGEADSDDFKLMYLIWNENPEDFRKQFRIAALIPNVRILLVNGNTAHYLIDDTHHSRYSPMGVRLGSLIAEHLETENISAVGHTLREAALSFQGRCYLKATKLLNATWRPAAETIKLRSRKIKTLLGNYRRGLRNRE